MERIGRRKTEQPYFSCRRCLFRMCNGSRLRTTITRLIDLSVQTGSCQVVVGSNTDTILCCFIFVDNPLLTYPGEERGGMETTSREVTTFVILGATGDLARKKLYPGLCALIKAGRLVRDAVRIVGCGRREVPLDTFLNKQCINVRQDKTWQRKEFYPLVSYVSLDGSYTNESAYRKLHENVKKTESKFTVGNRVFFLALPPHLFGPVTRLLSQTCVRFVSNHPMTLHRRFTVAFLTRRS